MIADAACEVAEANLSTTETTKVYSRLAAEPGVLSGAIGQVHPYWVEQIEAVQTRATESDGHLLQRYFEWRAKYALAALQHEKERLEEEDLDDV